MYKENQQLKVFRAVLIGMLVGLVLCSIMIVVLSDKCPQTPFLLHCRLLVRCRHF